MKKELIITSILGIVGILFFAFVLANSAKFKNMPKKQMPPTPTTAPQTTHIFTISDVANHATTNDCYMIINTKVYDVTSYLSKHKVDITSYCGIDATEAFTTKGGKGSHDARADEILQTLLIGTLQK